MRCEPGAPGDRDGREGAPAIRNEGASSRPRRWLPVLGIIIMICLVVLVVLLHVTGTIGPGIH